MDLRAGCVTGVWGAREGLPLCKLHSCWAWGRKRPPECGKEGRAKKNASCPHALGSAPRAPTTSSGRQPFLDAPRKATTQGYLARARRPRCTHLRCHFPRRAGRPRQLPRKGRSGHGGVAADVRLATHGAARRRHGAADHRSWRPALEPRHMRAWRGRTSARGRDAAARHAEGRTPPPAEIREARGFALA
eukprot:353141-Chlamydomonas_euryale.AAC.7